MGQFLGFATSANYFESLDSNIHKSVRKYCFGGNL